MNLSFEALEQALAPIEELGQGEVTFDVGKSSMTMRVLLPEEEAEVQKYANEKRSPDSDTPGHAMEFVERFKVAILSHAIVEVNGQNLRDVLYVETGEKLDNGVAVKIPKPKALRKLIEKWSSPVRLLVFRKYTELLAKVEKRAEEAIQFDPSDMDAEIERLEQRLDQLKLARDQEKETVESEVSKTAKILSREKEISKEEAEVLEDAPEPIQEPVRRTAIPPQAPPPPRDPPAATRAVQVPRGPRPADPASYVAGMDVPDSFINPDDSSTTGDAIAEENRRLLRQRQAEAAGYAPDEIPSVLTAVRRRPPHQAAAEAAPYTGEVVEGEEGYRVRPPEEISRPRTGAAPVKPKVDPSINPRFVAPRKP